MELTVHCIFQEDILLADEVWNADSNHDMVVTYDGFCQNFGRSPTLTCVYHSPISHSYLTCIYHYIYL